MIPNKYTKYIRIETGYGLLALTVALSASAIVPRWDSAIQYCVPNTECRVVKEVDPNTFNWHQEQARQNAEKLVQRKKTRKFSDKWYTFAQDTYSGWDNATYNFNEGLNNVTHTFSPRSTKEFLSITSYARRQGYQLKMVGELPGYGNWRKVTGALSLISIGGLMWLIHQLEEIQPKRDRIEELNFESALNRHQRALEGETTVITAEMDWEVAAGQRQLETKYLGDDSDEFLETLDAQSEEIGKDANRIEGMLNQITGTQTLDSINNPSDKVQGDNPSPAISSEKVQEIAQSLLQALNKLNYPSASVRSTVGHTIIEIVIKPNDVTKVKQLLGLGQALQVEMNLKSPPTITTVAGGVAIALPRPDRLFALFDKYVPDQHVDGIPKLVVGVDVYNQLHEYDLSSKAVESMIIGGIPKAGKSQLIISMIASGIRRYSPDQIKFLLFDGKEGVELGFLNGNSYLVHSVASSPGAVDDAIKWYGQEIERRFKVFKSKGVTNLDDYNSLDDIEKLPYIPAIADEIQNLFNLEKNSDEGGHLDVLSSIASLGRAAGMPLILSTQAPDRRLINRQIAAKCNSRIALKTESEGDSELIVRAAGAENLLARGDLLYRNGGEPPVRLQGLYIPEGERNKIFGFISSNSSDKVKDNPEDLLKRVRNWLNDLWDMSPDDVRDDGGRTSDKSKLFEQNLSDNARLILGWLRQHKSDGSWLKYRGKEGRDGNFINFLSDKGINRKLRDVAIEELETTGLIEVDDEKGMRLIGTENNQV